MINNNTKFYLVLFRFRSSVNLLRRRVVDFPSLEIFTTRPHKTLDNLI